jgi:surface antigen
LGENIKAMYLEGDISTLEMLASSRDLGEFVDKQQYRNSVKDKIRNTLDRVTALKLELKSQKEKLDKLIADQKTMQGQLALQRAEQDRLLNLNSEQRAALDSEMQANNSRIAELRQQQAIENAKHFRGVTIIPGHNGRDTYPDVWRNSPQDSMIDSWGMYNRECVSYTAWKVYSTGRYMPYWGGIGNANQWDDNARRMGIPVDTNPRPGDVAIAHWGYYGHAMYVESVNPDGTINISQYNWDFNGTYSEAYNFSTAGLVFIHFQ